jgi:hypothetical protein
MAQGDFVYVGDTITGLTIQGQAKTVLEIPNQIGGQVIKKLADGVFQYNTRIQGVTIAEGLTHIGASAFEYCTALTNVDMPSTIVVVGSNAFKNCSVLGYVVYPSLGVIADGAFANCTALAYIEIPTTVTAVGVGAFRGCTALSVIDLTNVTAVGADAFRGCTNLTIVDVPNLVTVGDGAFNGAAGIVGLELPNVTTIGANAFSGLLKLTTINFPKVQTIGNNAFAGTTMLTSMRFPTTLTSIGSGAFSSSSASPYGESITIPSSVTWMGSGVFAGRTGLTIYTSKTSQQPSEWDEEWMAGANRPTFIRCTYTVEGGYPYVSAIAIDTDTLANAGAVGGISAPKRRGYILLGYNTAANGSGAAYAITNSADWALVPQGITLYAMWGAANAEGDFTYSGNTITGLTEIGKLKTTLDIPNMIGGQAITTIGAGAFQNRTNITAVNIATGITTIQGSAFYNCTGIASLTLPEGLLTIGSGAFAGCTNAGLDLVLPTSIVTIGDYAFNNIGAVARMTQINLPNATRIGAYAFYGAVDARAISLPKAQTIGDFAFFGAGRNGNLEALNLATTLTSIGTGAFRANADGQVSSSRLGSVTIPANVTTIGAGAFANHPKLTIYAPQAAATTTYNAEFNTDERPVVWGVALGAAAGFAYVTGFTKSAVSVDNADGGITVPTRAGSYVFTNWNTAANGSGTQYDLLNQNSVDGIGNGTVLYALWEIRGEDGFFVYAGNIILGLTELGREQATLSIPNMISGVNITAIGNEAFYNNTVLTAITIPNTVTKIGVRAFLGCTFLTTVTMSSSLQVMGEGAFANCTALTTITLPSTLLKIPEAAFNACSLLAITIPTTVTYIGDYAFGGTAVTAVNVPNCTYIGERAFNGCAALASVSAPAATVIGKYAFGGCPVLASANISGVIEIGNYAFAGTALNAVNLPNVKSIGEYAFENCGEIVTLSIGAGVLSIGDSAFKDCDKIAGTLTLTGAMDGEGKPLAIIGNNAFYRNLTTFDNYNRPITLELRNIKTVGEYSFAYRSFVGTMVIDNVETVSANAFYCAGYCFNDNSVRTHMFDANISNVGNIGYQAFYNAYGLRNLTITNAVKVGDGAFYRSRRIESYNLSYITKICYQTFYECSTELPTGVTATMDAHHITNFGAGYDGGGSDPMGQSYMFGYGNNNFSTITLHDIETIATYTFYEVGVQSNSIVDITLNNIGRIEAEAFYNMYGLRNLTADNIGYIGNRAFYYTRYSTAPDGTMTLLNVGAIAGGQVFSNSHFKTITIKGNGLELMGEYMFTYCERLTDLNLWGVTKLGQYAIQNCTQLVNLNIPDIVYLDYNAIAYNGGELRIHLPQTITTLGNDTNGNGCLYLNGTAVTIPTSVQTITAYGASNSSMTVFTAASKGNLPVGWHENAFSSSMVFYNCTYGYDDYAAAGDARFPYVYSWTKDGLDNIKTSGDYLWSATLYSPTRRGYDFVEWNTQPDGMGTTVDLLGTTWYSGYPSLPDATFYTIWESNATTESGYFTYRGHTITGLTELGRAQTVLNIPATLDNGTTINAIAKNAFYGNKVLTTVTINNAIQSIGDAAFRDCTNLTTITFPTSAPTFGTGVLYNCTNLTLVTLPTNLTTVPVSMFQYCTNITDIGFLPTTVTTISSGAFAYTGVKKIVFQPNIATIDRDAFYGCTNLTHVYIPKSVTHIGGQAFRGCTKLTSVTWPAELANLPNQSYGAFYDTNYAPKYVSHTSQQPGWGSYYNEGSAPLFWGCTLGYDDINVGDQMLPYVTSWTKVSSSSMQNSGNGNPFRAPNRYGYDFVEWNTAANGLGTTVVLKTNADFNAIVDGTTIYAIWTVAIPEVSVGDFIYKGNTIIGLTPQGRVKTTITIPNTLNGQTITTIGADLFRSRRDMVSITIQSGITTIGNYAFYECGYSVATPCAISIPSTVTTIENYAFANCHYVTFTADLSGVVSVGDYAFYRARLLNAVNMPACLTIGNYAFAYDDYATPYQNETTAITTINLPVVVTIGNYAFNKANLATSVNLGNSLVSIGQYAFYALAYDVAAGSRPSVVVPNTTTTINSFAFAYARLSNFTLGTGVTSTANQILNYAEITNFYYNATNITSSSNQTFSGLNIGVTGVNLFVGANVTNIPTNAFYRNSSYASGSNIRSVTFATGGAGCDIGQYAFASQTALINIDLGGVTVIQNCAFAGCTNVETLNIGADITLVGMNDWSISITFNGLGTAKAAGVAVTVGPAVTKIADGMFKDYLNNDYVRITSLAFTGASACTTIGDYAFYGVARLANINWGTAPIATIGNNAFQYAFYGNDCEPIALTLPTTATTIGNYAFANNDKITGVTLPATALTIGNYAFAECTALSIPALKNTTAIGAYAFYNCDGESADLTIGASVADIGANAFQNAESVRTVTFAGSPATIGTYAFSGCTNLAEVTIPNTCAFSLASYMFQNCTRLRTANLEGVTIINTYCFVGCTALINIYTQKLTRIELGAIQSCTSLQTIQFPTTFTSYDRIASGGTAITTLPSLTIPSSTTILNNGSIVAGMTNMTIYWGGARSGAATVGCYVENCTFAIEDGVPYVASFTKTATMPNGGANMRAPYRRGYKFLGWDTASDGTGTRYAVNGTASAANATVLYAIWEPITSSGFFTYDGDTITGLTALGKAQTALTVPSVLDDMTVITTIGNNAFQYEQFESVIVGAGITRIGNSAFRDCAQLTSLTLPNGLLQIGEFAFRQAFLNSGLGESAVVIPDSVTTMGNGVFQEAMVKSVTIGSGIVTIPQSTFSSCVWMSSVTIPTSITTIGNEAFYQCTRLETITLPSSVTTIGNSVFRGCNRLTTAVLPSVTTLGTYAFYGCTALQNVTLNNTLTAIPEYMFYQCAALPNLDFVPLSVTGIGQYAFASCRFADINLPNVTTISNNAFADNTTNLVTINLPSVISIGVQAFYRCNAVKNVNIPLCQTIGNDNFYSTSNSGAIENIQLPDTLTSIGTNFLRNATANTILKTVLIPSSVDTIGSDFGTGNNANTIFSTQPSKPTNWNATWNAANRPVFWNSEYLFDNGVRYVSAFTKVDGNSLLNPDATNGINFPVRAGYLFLGWNTAANGTGEYYSILNSSTFARIPNDTKLFAVWATQTTGDIFLYSGSIITGLTDYGKSLVSISVPDTLGGNPITTIGMRAFKGATNLVSVTIPNGVTTVGGEAFSGCTNLVGVKLPNSVTSIGASAFYECAKLPTVALPTNLRTIDDSAFRGCTGLITIKMPNTVTWIGDSIFYGCAKLENVTLSNQLTGVPSYAFYGCARMTTPTFASTITEIGAYAFANCVRISGVLTVPSIVSRIGSYAFSGCTGITAVVVNSTVKIVIDTYAFSNCTAITSANLYSSADMDIGTSTSANNLVFNGCTRLNTVTVGGIGAIRILYGAFYNLDSITTLNLNNGITYIGTNAFYDCDYITNINIPNSVTNIYASTFQSCDRVTTLTIGTGVTSIGQNAFNGLQLCGQLNFNAINTSIYDSAVFGSLGYSLAIGVRVVFGNLVESVPDNIFYNNNQKVRSVTWGTNIRTIGANAFRGQTASPEFVNLNLTATALVSVGNAAFYGCTNIQTVTFPNTLTTLGNQVFQTDTALTSVSFGTGLQTIGTSAFQGCTALTAINTPDSITTIGEGAFYGCTAVTTITLGANLTAIAATAFYNLVNCTTVYYRCANLTTVANTSGASNTVFYRLGYNNRTGFGTEAGVAVYIGSTATTIAGGLFYYATVADQAQIASVSVDFGSSLERIKLNAFRSIGKLTTFNFGDAPLIEIQEYAFYNCTALTGAVLPDTTVYIRQYAFEGDTALATLSLGNSLVQVDRNAFNNCSNSGITEIVIPDTTIVIAMYAFQGMTGVKSVTLGTALKTIGYRALSFLNAETLVLKSEEIITLYNAETTTVTAGTTNQSLYRLGYNNRTGNGTGNGVALTIAPTVVKIANGMFYGAVADQPQIASVTIEGGSTLATIGNNAFFGITKLSAFAFENAPIVTIMAGAFQDCTGLSAISISDSIQTIAANAFSGCTNATTLTLGAGLTSWQNNSFYNLEKVATVYLNIANSPSAPVTALTADVNNFYRLGCNTTAVPNGTNVIVGAGCIRVPASMFYSTNTTVANRPRLRNLTFVPSGAATTIGANAFRSVQNLNTVTLDNTNITLIDNTAFYQVTSLANLSLPQTLITIGSDAFNGCSGLTNVDFESTALVSVGNNAFQNCTNNGFTSVSFPTTTTVIGNNAFQGCAKLTSVQMPAVTTINTYAFAQCTELQDIFMPSVVTLGTYAFYRSLKVVNFVLPTTLTTFGGYAFEMNVSPYNVQSQGVTIPTEATFTGGIPDYGFQEMRNTTYYVAESAKPTAWNANWNRSNRPIVWGCEYGYDDYVENSGDGRFPYVVSWTKATSSSIGNANNGISNPYRYGYTFIKWAADAAGAGAAIPLTTQAHYNALNVGDKLFAIWEKKVIGVGEVFVITSGGNISGLTEYGKTLDTIEIPAVVAYVSYTGNINTISASAFRGRTNITTVNFELPSNLTIINPYAFQNCTALTSISIPASVTKVDTSAFQNCYALTSITFPNTAPTFGENVFMNCIALTTVTLPPVDEIPTGMFSGCYRINTINFNPLNTIIGDSAFFGCSGLVTLTIPSHIVKVRTNAFSNCTNITTLNLNLTADADPAQANDYTFGYQCFANLTRCKTFNLNTTTNVGKTLRYYVNAFTDFGRTGSASTQGVNVIVGPDIKSIPSTYFYDNSAVLLSLDLSNATSLISIGSNAFRGKGLISTLNLQAPLLTTIGEYAFYGCSDVTSLTLGTAITTIGQQAFYGCTNVQNVYYNALSPNVTVGNNAFYRLAYNRTNGANFIVGDGVEKIADRIFDTTDIANGSKIYTVDFGPTCTEVGAASFRGQSTILELQFENTPITTIGDNAFNGLAYITGLTLPKNITKIGSNAFAGLTRCEFVLYDMISPTVARDALAGLGSGIGTNKTLNVEIGPNVVVLSRGIFNNITVNFAVVFATGEGFTEIGEEAFMGCTRLAEIHNIPETVTAIGDRAFQNCTGLLAITFSNGLLSIGAGAFEGCTILGNRPVQLPNGLKTIGVGAFRNCANLLSLTLPDSLAEAGGSIGSAAFGGCNNLTLYTSAVYRHTAAENDPGSAVYDLKRDYETLMGAGGAWNGSNSSNRPFAFGCEYRIDPLYLQYSYVYRISKTNRIFGGNENVEWTGIDVATNSMLIQPPYRAGHSFKWWDTNINGLGDENTPSSVVKLASSDDYLDWKNNQLYFANIFSIWEREIETSMFTFQGSRVTGLTAMGRQETDFILPTHLGGVAITEIGNSAFIGLTNIRSFRIEANIITVYKNAFRNCTNLETLTFNGYGLLAIQDSAFQNCTSLLHISIPLTVTEIGNSAFRDTTKLTTAVIPTLNNLAHIYPYAFYNSGIQEINIKGSIASNTVIDNYAFYGCPRLTTVTIGSGVREIKAEAFAENRRIHTLNWDAVDCLGFGSANKIFWYMGSAYNVSSWQTAKTRVVITIGVNCEVIPAYFMNNEYLYWGDYSSYTDAIIIENGRTKNLTVGVSAFQNNIRLDTITNLNPGQSGTIGGKVNVYQTNAFANCQEVTTLTIGSDVTSIGAGAFAAIDCLNEINFHTNQLSSTNANMFSNSGRTSSYTTKPAGAQITVTFGINVTAVPENLFYSSGTGDYPAVYTVVFAGGENHPLTTIRPQAFRNCNGMASNFPTPKALRTIQARAFQNTNVGYLPQLLDTALTSIGDYAFESGYMFELNCPATLAYIGTDAFKDAATSRLNFAETGSLVIYGGAFQNCNIRELVVKPSVAGMGSSAFQGNTQLTRLDLSQATTVAIGSSAFMGCTALTTIDCGAYIVRPDGIETPVSGNVSFGASIFKDCTALLNVTLNNRISAIGAEAFKGCTLLRSFRWPTTVTIVEADTFNGCAGLVQIALPASVTQISSNAFNGCYMLYSLTIPSGVSYVGANAFLGCSNLTLYTHRPTGTSTWNLSNRPTIYGCELKTEEDAEELNALVGYEYVYAYYVSHLRMFTIAVSGDNCTITGLQLAGLGMSYIQIPRFVTLQTGEKVWKITDDNGTPDDFTDDIGEWVMELKTYTVTGISGFANNTLLKRIILPDGLERIAASTFDGCINLESITIPSSVTYIGQYAFRSCSSLTIYTDKSQFIKGAGAPNNFYYYQLYPSGGNIGEEDKSWNSSNRPVIWENTYATDTMTDTSTYSYVNVKGNDRTGVVAPDHDPLRYLYDFAGWNGNQSTWTFTDEAPTVESVISFNGPTRNKHQFIGWNELSDGTGTWYYFATTLDAPTLPIDQSIYTQWIDEEESDFIITNGTIIGLTEQGKSKSDLVVPNHMSSDSASPFITAITENAFKNVATIVTMNFDPEWATRAGGQPTLEIRAGAFFGCKNMREINFPSVLTTIGDGAFENCTALTRIEIPNATTTIGNRAFINCGNAVELRLGDIESGKLYSIGDSAFENCTKITSAILPNTTRYAGRSAFSNCGEITTIYIGRDFRRFGNTAQGDNTFLDCKKVTTINFNAVSCNALYNYGSSYYSSWWNGVFENCGTSASGITVTIGANVTHIPDFLFGSRSNYRPYIRTVRFETKLVNVEAGGFTYNNVERSDCTYIGTGSFAFLSALSTLTLAEGLVTIYEAAFVGTLAFALNIPSTVTTIANSITLHYNDPDGVFEDSRLTSISFNTSVTGPRPNLTIGTRAFFNCDIVTAITLDDYVTSIGANIFQDCGALATVTIGYGITTIPENAFYNCTKISTLTLGGNVRIIGTRAFSKDSSIISVTVPDSLQEFGTSSFEDCINLETLVITPESDLRYIRANAFKNTKLRRMFIPKMVTDIGEDAFANCAEFTHFDVSTLNDYYGGYDGLLYNKAFTVLIRCPGGRNTVYDPITIHDNTIDIYARAFQNCTLVNVLNLPGTTPIGNPNAKNLVTIGQYAFENCTSLMAIRFPTTMANAVRDSLSVPAIGNYAFRGCTALELVEFGTGASMTIGQGAFYGDKAIKNLVITNRVIGINYQAFGDCSITSLVIDDGSNNLSIGQSAFSTASYGNNGAWYSGSGSVTMAELTIPNRVTNIGDGAFSECIIRKLTLNDGSNALNIQIHAFYSAGINTVLNIPTRVTTIGNQSFTDNSIAQLAFTMGGTRALTIGAQAFTSGIVANTTVTFPNRTETIGGGTGTSISGGAFAGVKFADILFQDVVANTATVPATITPNISLTIQNGAFLNCGGGATLTLPIQTISIGREAFRGCIASTINIKTTNDATFKYDCGIGESAFRGFTNLTTLTFGSGVTTIGNYAFEGCNRLQVLNLGSRVSTIGEGAFQNCTNLLRLDFAQNSALSVIGALAFQNCTYITTIALGNGVSSIGERAFQNCQSMQTITVDPSNAWYNVFDNILYGRSGVNDRSSLVYCPQQRVGDIYILSEGERADGLGGYASTFGTSSIGAYAFDGCTNIASIFIPTSVSSIGTNAFNNCSSLASITLPTSVTSRGANMFNGNTSLTIYTNQSAPSTGTLPSWVSGATVVWECTMETYTVGEKAPNNVPFKVGGVNFYDIKYQTVKTYTHRSANTTAQTVSNAARGISAPTKIGDEFTAWESGLLYNFDEKIYVAMSTQADFIQLKNDTYTAQWQKVAFIDVQLRYFAGNVIDYVQVKSTKTQTLFIDAGKGGMFAAGEYTAPVFVVGDNDDQYTDDLVPTIPGMRTQIDYGEGGSYFKPIANYPLLQYRMWYLDEHLYGHTMLEMEIKNTHTAPVQFKLKYYNQVFPNRAPVGTERYIVVDAQRRPFEDEKDDTLMCEYFDFDNVTSTVTAWVDEGGQMVQKSYDYTYYKQVRKRQSLIIEETAPVADTVNGIPENAVGWRVIKGTFLKNLGVNLSPAHPEDDIIDTILKDVPEALRPDARQEILKTTTIGNLSLDNVTNPDVDLFEYRAWLMDDQLDFEINQLGIYYPKQWICLQLRRISGDYYKSREDIGLINDNPLRLYAFPAPAAGRPLPPVIFR